MAIGNKIYKQCLKFKSKYPWTISWRLGWNASVVEMHVNPDEKILYSFAAQKNDNPFNIIGTAVITLTSKRLLIGRKRVLFGYFLNAITPDMFNDLKITSGLIWGKVHIDKVKEHIILSNIDKKALIEIETVISTYMMEEKKKYANYVDSEN